MAINEYGALTVAQLIKKLQACKNQNAEVWTEGLSGEFYPLRVVDTSGEENGEIYINYYINYGS